MKFATGIVFAFACIASAFAEPTGKKFIATGWDLLRIAPEEILKNADAFADSGLDGVCLVFSVRGKCGETLSHHRILSRTQFDYGSLKKFVPVFRDIVSHKGLSESFLTVYWCPKPEDRLRWDDDDGWKIFAGNMAVVAQLAKEGGLKGLFLDWEDYGNSKQFKHTENDPPLAETIKLARERGREIGNAVFGAFPDIRFFSYWWLCVGSDFAGLQGTECAYRQQDFVWGAFVNGLLDVIPETAQLIDGREHYHLESCRRDFYKHSADIQIACQSLVEPENRAKYRRALSVSFGHYLDMYVNDESVKRWYFGPEGGSRLEHFRRNIEQAARAASEYVWLYGEKGLYVPYKGCGSKWVAKQKPWEELLPGWSDALKKVKSSWETAPSEPAKKRGRTSASPRPSAAAKPNASASKAMPDAQGELPRKFILCADAIAAMRPRALLANADAFASFGIDGVVFSLSAVDRSGKRAGSGGLASRGRLSVPLLKPYVRELKEMAAKPGLKESLLYFGLCPEKKNRLPWGADARWELCAHNAGLMAKLAKATGIKGLFLDPRDSSGAKQFAITEKEGYGRDELKRLARRRGREFGKAVFAEYPDIVLYSTAWFSAEAAVAEAPDAAEKAGSLWPDFVNGVLDVMPEGAKLVDGCCGEACSADKRDYCKRASDTLAAGRVLAEGENFGKLQGALSISSGDVLDRYKTAGGADAFWRNLSRAAAVSSEYVLLDAEKNAVTGKEAAALDGAIPGWRDAILQVKDERAWIRRHLEKNAKSAVDLVADSACANGVGGGFFAYIDRKTAPDASIETDTTVGEGDLASFKMTGCGMAGTLMFRVQGVKPCEKYIVQFSTKGYPVAAKVSWRENSKFRWDVPSIGMPLSMENAAGWRTASRIVRTPDAEGYNEMYLMIDMRHCGKSDESWVDNVHVYKLDDIGRSAPKAPARARASRMGESKSKF